MEPIKGFYASFINILEINLEAIEKVNRMLEVADIDQIKEVRGNIQDMEEKVDEIKDGIIDRHYEE